MAKSKSAPSAIAVDDKWQVESDMRTLRNACEILKDGDRMKKVKELIGEETEALEELADFEGLRRYGKD